MTTDTPETLERSKSPLRWPKRVEYSAGTTRRQRKQQYQQQMNVLITVLIVTVATGALVVLVNWREAGSTQEANCLNYPQYCVPLAGGSDISADLEAASARKLEAKSEGVDGVIRYIADDTVPTLGDPDAPIHFRTVSNFACGHCNSYHTDDMEQFIEDYVLEGQATLGAVMVTGMAQEYTSTATQAALCAGEQGAFWEMTDELYRIARTRGYQTGFSVNSIRDSAQQMGLDEDAIDNCIADGRYINVVNNYSLFSADNGVTGTPTVLMRYDDSDEWVRVDRRYQNLAQLTEEANAQTQ